MRAALLIAMREIHERRAVLAAALVAGLLPFASPLFPGVSGENAAQAREVMATILSLGFGLVLSVLLGATALARDLAENRLGFDFALPVGALSIWSGRFGAAVGLTLAATAVIVAPTTLVGGRLWLPEIVQPRGVFGFALFGAVLFLVGAAHFAGVAFRSRSRWLALDLVGLVVVLLLGAAGVRQIHDAFAVTTSIVVAIAAALTIIPALWIASAVQVARGRVDPVLGHRVQSITLWSMLLAVGLSVAGYGWWFVTPGIDDLVTASAEPSPRGPWVTLDGMARGRPGLVAQFLLNTESGRSVRLGPGDLRSGNATLYSQDGRRVVWLHGESSSDPTIEVALIDLDLPDPHPIPTSITFDRLTRLRTDLSPSGARLATLQGRNLAVHDLDTGKILAAAALERVEQGWGRMRIAFVDENRVRVYVFGERLGAYELDVTKRKLVSWNGPELGEHNVELRWRPAHDRLIVSSDSSTDGRASLLLDGRSGATVTRLMVPSGVSSSVHAFLADGRIARISEASPGSAALDLLTSDGEPLESINLGTGGPDELFWLGAEAAPGTLLVGRASWVEYRADSGSLILIDTESHRIRAVEGGGSPVAAMSWVAQQLPAQVGSVAARLVQRRESVWLLDVDAGQLRFIAGRPAQP